MSVCDPCEPMLPLVVIDTVTVHVPPLAGTVHDVGETEYGALRPLRVNDTDWLPELVKVTVPVAAAAP